MCPVCPAAGECLKGRCSSCPPMPKGLPLPPGVGAQWGTRALGQSSIGKLAPLCYAAFSTLPDLCGLGPICGHEDYQTDITRMR